jgi:hypothetical protein
MVWLALVLFVATTIAVVRGGRLRNLSDIRLRMWWLLILGFGMQSITGLFPEDADWSRPTGITLILLSYAPLLLMVVLNREKPGMWLAGLGILMNFSVIAANGGMPVLEEAAIVAGGFPESVDLTGNYKHLVLDETSHLAFLADVIPLRFLGQGQVISLGDVLLAVGLGRFLEHELRRPVRWFKHGAQAEAGSARRD